MMTLLPLAWQKQTVTLSENYVMNYDQGHFYREDRAHL